ncbi:hypothetical protein ACFXGA_15975 [Actinosynnema sp. NPDC059335]|uniref:PASTA domain-containing protein n=1 Tax=Actinosynnema sp. NPDC059335 TaxID=3346804 RepID=UPI0036733640
MRIIRSSVALAAVAALAACSPTPTTPGPTIAVTPATEPAAPTEPPATAAGTCTVPDVVGMVHQAAQDTLQAAGFFKLREEDATGQGRLLVVDRNWTTTAQSVPAGQVVDCDTEILLSAKKTGE